MKKNFEIIKSEVNINNVATRLLGKPIRGMYRFPGERTPSIKVYPETQSYYDFGRGSGGDCIRLWSHVKGCDNWTALSQISALYGLSTALNEKNRESIVANIKAQETAQKKREQDEKRKRKQWVIEVNRLQEWRRLCQNLLDSGHLPPFCYVRGWCYSEIQMADYQLDILCGIEK